MEQIEQTSTLLFKNPGQANAQSGQGNPSGIDLGALFTDLLKRSGDKLGTGLSVVSAQAKAQFTSPETESAPPAENPRPESKPENHSRDNETNQRTENSDPDRDSSRPDRSDQYGRDHDSADTRERYDDNAGKNSDVKTSDRGSDGTQHDDTSAPNNQADNKPTDNAKGSNDQSGSANETASDQNSANNGSGSNGQQAATGDDSAAAQTLGVLQNAEAIISELIAAAEANVAPGQGLQTGDGRGEGNANPANALQGLAKAIAALGNQASQQQSAQAGPQNLPPEIQAIAKALVEARANVKGQAENGPVNTTTTTVQQQAQGLAQAIGEGNKAQVSVRVTSESATLVSQPTSNLTSNAVAAGDGSNASLHAQQAAHNTAAAAANPGAQQAAANNAGQVQQASTQSSQAQVAGTTSLDAKAAGPVTPNTAGQGTPSGGGEGQTSSGSQGGSQESQQTQQSNQAQAAHKSQFNVPRQAVLDQITVHITRAIQAGMDKINIQLRPESLGRVDVQLEMVKDGKMTAVVYAENKDTLDLLQRDVKELAKALQDAGLNTEEGDIDFNLRGREDQADGQDGGPNGSPSDGDENGDNELAANNDNGNLEEDVIEDDRINIRV